MPHQPSRWRVGAAWVVLGWTYAVTFSRGLRTPNDFAEAYWLIDYRFGFVRRGLVGSLFHIASDATGVSPTPQLILVLSAFTLVTMTAALLLCFLRAYHRHQEREGAFVLGIIVASSPLVVMNAHTIGYFDALVYTAAVVAIALTLSDRPYWAALVSSVAILVHENYLLLGLPLVALASFATVGRVAQPARHRSYLGALCPPVAVFVVLTVLPLVMAEPLARRAQVAEHLDSFGFVSSRSAVVAVFETSTIWGQLRTQASAVDNRLLDPRVLMPIGPTLLALLVWIHTSFRIRAFGPMSLGLLAVIGAPLAIHMVAWDTQRIWTYPVATAFLAWWILCETRAPRIRIEGTVLLIACYAVIVNAFSTMPLMDGEIERLSHAVRMAVYLPPAWLLASIVFRQTGCSQADRSFESSPPRV